VQGAAEPFEEQRAAIRLGSSSSQAAAPAASALFLTTSGTSTVTRLRDGLCLQFWSW